ncbi:MAG: HEAT repeat domain-containing protein [Candidatus Thorarchaeota archaeon]|nr:HEAT repeat domain-containing protein [Candidatus Thorarchaeota archaeon]
MSEYQGGKELSKAPRKSSKAKGTKKTSDKGTTKSTTKKKQLKTKAERKTTTKKPPVKKKTEAKPKKTHSLADELAKEIHSEDEQVSLGAIDALGKVKDPSATQYLIGCLNDSRYLVRIYAAIQLGERKDKKAVDSLIKALDDESLFVRQTIAGALENIGGEKATAAVKAAEERGLLLDELPEGKKLGFE